MAMHPELSKTDPELHEDGDPVREPLSARQGGSNVGFIVLVLSPLVLLCGISFPLVILTLAIAVLGFMIWYPMHEWHSHHHHH